MGSTLFTNVRILDGTGAAPYAGEVLVQGNRITRVGRGDARRCRPPNATVIDGAGATLMPGMVEAHTHFSWNDAATLQEIQRMPLEEHVLWTAERRQALSRGGWTSCVGAACAKARLDVVMRNAINEGLIPGPRYLAASQEITVAGGLGDETLPHIPYPEFSFGVIVSGPEEMRKAVRMFLKYGVDSIKLNLSGDNFTPASPAGTTWMSDEEVAMAVHETHMRGKRVAAHARSCASVKQACATASRSSTTRASSTRRRWTCWRRTRTGTSSRPASASSTRCSTRRSRGASTRAKAVEHGLRDRVGGRDRVAVEDAQARHPRAARRRLRIRLHAALPERPRPRAVRQVPRLHADGGDPVGDQLRRRDHDARPRAGPAQRRLSGRRASSWTAIRLPNLADPARAGQDPGGHEGRRVLQGARAAGGALALGALGRR